METKWKSFLEKVRKQTGLWYAAGGIASVLMVVIILCNLLLIISNVREPNQMPSVFGVRPAIVLSGSMSPAFEAGDVILLKKTKTPEELEVGDVACYLYGGKATTHRIIERFEAEGKPRYIMKGDFNNVEDRLAVDPEQIQGVWTGGRIRHLGKLLIFMQSTMGMFLLLICPLAGLLGWDIVKRRREDQNRQEAWERGELAGGQRGAGEAGETSPLRKGLNRLLTAGEHGTEGELGERSIESGTRSEHSIRRGQVAERISEAESQNEYRRMEEELAYYRRQEEARRREATTAAGRGPQMKEQFAESSVKERRSFQNDHRSRQTQGLEEEFAYYSSLEDELDYYEELEVAAEHYRKMKESLTRYRKMEAMISRCRKLEEELARYEELANRLEAYERRERGNGHR